MTTHINTGTPQLVASVDGHTATITLNNPERHNAITHEMFGAFGTAASGIQQIGDVRVIVLRGAGDKAFAAGADIGGLSEEAAQPNGLPLLAALGIPIVAELKGWCIGGGLMTALFADLRIAADTTTLGIPAAKLGVGYPLPATQMLVDTVGDARATEMLLLGENMDAATAAAIGLVHQVVPVADLTEAVNAVASTLSRHAPLSLRAAKAGLASARRPDDPDRAARANTAIAATWDSADFAEGTAAFRERRQPRFTGR